MVKTLSKGVKTEGNKNQNGVSVIEKIPERNTTSRLYKHYSAHLPTSEVASYQTKGTTKYIQTRSDSNNSLAVLAPVKRPFLYTAIKNIYPIYKKVSFGTDKVEELQAIRNDFLNAMNDQGTVYVYIYFDGSAQYKTVLIDEFLFYTQITSHPDPWGSWNKNFKSYYTVKDIVSCNIPLHKFKSSRTGKVIENARRPLRVVDPQ